MSKSSLGKKHGIHTCNVCGVKFKRWCDAPILLICQECYGITITCEQCGKPARKYTEVARLRRFCDGKCRGRYNASKTAESRSKTMTQKHKSDPVYHARAVAALKQFHGLSQTKENFDAISKRLVDRWKNNDYRAKMSSMSRRLWENRDKMLDAIQWKQNKMTSLERAVNDVISWWGIEYCFNYMVGRYFIDFAFPEYMIGIECDGAYWHNNRKEKDEKRDNWLSSRGWKIIRLTESEIEHDVHMALSTKVLPIIESAIEFP